MTFGTLGVLVMLIFSICGVGGAWRRTLGLDRPQAAALCLLLLFMGGISIAYRNVFALGLPAILIVSGLLWRVREPMEILLSLLLSLLAGILAWLLTLPGFMPTESGVMIAIPALLLSLFVRKEPKTAMLLLALAPLMYGICAMFEHVYLFGTPAVALGTGEQYDAQIFALLAWSAATGLAAQGRAVAVKLKIRT